MNLPPTQANAAIAFEQTIRAERFETLTQLRREQSLLERRIALAELELADSDREVGRLRMQLHRAKDCPSTTALLAS